MGNNVKSDIVVLSKKVKQKIDIVFLSLSMELHILENQ
jgi:hypothetical protein